MNFRQFPAIVAAFSLVVLGSAALAQEGAAGDDPPKAQDCSAHRFETVLERVVDGETKHSRLKLCGTTGQSDEDWIATLEDAIDKLRANNEMPEAMRSQAIAAITTEVARLRAPVAGPAYALPQPNLVPRTVTDRALDSDYASLPPLPPPVATTAVPPPSVDLPPAGASTPSIVSSPGTAKRPRASSPASAPNLSFLCVNTGDIAGPAPCAEFERETQLTVRAKADLPAVVSLHFERNGSDRASVDIGPLKKGRSTRLTLPRKVCEGVGDGSLMIVIWDGASPVGRDGPYSLRC